MFESSMAFPIPPFGWKREFDFFTFTVPNEAKISSIYLSVDGRSWASIGDPAFSSQYGFVVWPSNGDLLPQWGLTSVVSGAYGMYMSDDDLQSFPTTLHYGLGI